MVSRTPRGGRRLMHSSYNRSGSRTYTPRSNRGTDVGTSPSPPPSQKRRLDGLYLEENWYCNCAPRQQALLLQVKKKNANHGRFFYKCEKRKGGCNFFLWEEDARNRAETATLTLPPMPTDGSPAAGTTPTAQFPTPSTASAARSGVKSATTAPPPDREAPPSPTTQKSAARQKFLDAYFSARPPQAAAEANGPLDEAGADAPSHTTKRKRVIFDFDSDDGEDEYGLGDVSSDEERAMNEAMERSAKKLRETVPLTPYTPVAQRMARDVALPTPQTVTRTLFPDAKRRKPDDVGKPAVESPNVSFSTKTSSATVGPSSSPASRGEEQLDPTKEVLALLAGRAVDDTTMRGVGDLLRRFSMKAQGLAKGRETVRAALKVKDEKIAELQERIASLEARNRAQREEIADFKAGMMDLYSKH
ncbi:Putative Zinc finger, GRF-type [Colletotrichum destructivum]|uniref:Zinc finger, GRF-type n=1 Tax=Colletotrichum destructivum TaxID=34406 RepID=A0AAX4I4F5_9PEZI|nr:Putative Zinc finger, GRF-type [Colletotrichum destructivum]